MNELDAVVIATPPLMHAPISIDAMQAGKHVFCEKVMALDIESCNKMVIMQKETKKILQIGFQRLFDLRYIKSLEVIKSGTIGPITMVRAYWHRNDDPQDRIDHFKRFGFDTLVIWESELGNSDIKERLINFHEKGVECQRKVLSYD